MARKKPTASTPEDPSIDVFEGDASAPLANPKHELFARRYCTDLNATAAYASVYGCAQASAESGGARLLGSASVAARTAFLLNARNEALRLTAERTVQEVGYLAFSDIGDVLDFTGDTLRLKTPSSIPESARRAIKKVKVRFESEARVVNGAVVPVEVQLVEFELHAKEGPLRAAMAHLGIDVPAEARPEDSAVKMILLDLHTPKAPTTTPPKS